mmetsp:Transcript_21836/g.49459  ORF Transcript_21836/g.49459 Transcript_21836/m.49459 type:complete len:386 (+) Transcript_21836:219-1376(+)
MASVRDLSSRRSNPSSIVLSLVVGICVGLQFRRYTAVPSPDEKNLPAQVEAAARAVPAPDGASEKYLPAQVEEYMIENYERFGWSKTDSSPPTCQIWLDENATTPEIFSKLTSYKQELERYYEKLDGFAPNVTSLLSEIKRSGTHQVCDTLRMHPDGLPGFFPSGQLSLTSSGYVEPLLPPMRHMGICTNFKRKLMAMDYMVHDFEMMCRKIKPTSRLVLIDMGASLDFHGSKQPIMWLLALYEKMGFLFDHIYAFEITKSDPNHVYNVLPEKYVASYHWINVGVSADPESKLNPIHSILGKFNEDDFIVVKLDIDTHAVEWPLCQQLLQGDEIHKKVDQFYFEHHVHLGELNNDWKHTQEGSIIESLETFSQLRKKKIPSHFWP